MENCLSCGAPTKKIGERHVKYCNLRCKYDYDNKISRKVFKEIKCKTCENVFMPKRSNSKYCSTHCTYIAALKIRSKKPDIKKCGFCKNEFKPYNSLDKFCSANCRTENMKSKRSKRWSKDATEKRMGKLNPAYVHGMAVMGVKKDSTGLRLFQKNSRELREEMMNEHGYMFCEHCKVPSKRLECHHLIYRSEKPNHEHLHGKKNILIVCVPCHNLFHKSKGVRNEIVLNRGLHLLFGQDVLDK